MKLDLPVGKNLQDHITAFVGPFTVNKSVTFHLDRDSDLAALYNFAGDGTGPLTSTGIQASGFIVSDHAKASGETSWPDIQFMLMGAAIYDSAPESFESAFNLRSGILQKYYESALGKDSFTIVTSLARPKSRGEILLAGTDPKLPPLMNPNYFQHEDDIKVLVQGNEQETQYR